LLAGAERWRERRAGIARSAGGCCRASLERTFNARLERPAGNRLSRADRPFVAPAVVSDEELEADAADGSEGEARGVWEVEAGVAVGEGGCVGAAENEWAEREVDLIDEPGLKQAGVEFAPALAEEPFDAPVATEPAQRGSEVHRTFAEQTDCVCVCGQLLEAPGRGGVAGEEDEGGGLVLEDAGRARDAGGSADHDAQRVPGACVVVLRATAGFGVWTEVGVGFDEGAGAGHDGVSGGAEGEQVIDVVRAAEGGEAAVVAGDLAIRGEGEVQEDERAGLRGWGWRVWGAGVPSG
jgi:hypothetical protein